MLVKNSSTSKVLVERLWKLCKLSFIPTLKYISSYITVGNRLVECFSKYPNLQVLTVVEVNGLSGCFPGSHSDAVKSRSILEYILFYQDNCLHSNDFLVLFKSFIFKTNRGDFKIEDPPEMECILIQSSI